jgi:DHA2 family multidrug resistance protein
VTSFLEDAKHRVETTSVDWWGIGLLAVGLGSLQYVLEEGNTDDWFESATILRLTIIGVISVIAFLAWELSPKNKGPIVNLRVLKNRDLSAALILFMALGFGLYGGIFIFPLFAQSILHFTPTTTGLVLMPGAMATGVAAILCGRILNGSKQVISPRAVIIFGVVLFVYSMWDMGHLTTMSGEPDTRLALIIRGFGLGCLFTPINLAAFSSLKGVEIAQGASLLNLMRQLGGSFGIAYLGTHITNTTAANVNNLSGYLYEGNPAFDTRLQTLQSAMQGRGYDAETAHTLALQLIQNTVHVQAQVMSYNSAFLFIGLAMVVVSPCVFLLRSGKAQVSAAEMGH